MTNEKDYLGNIMHFSLKHFLLNLKNFELKWFEN